MSPTGLHHEHRVARRFDARAALVALASAQERHFLRYTRYADRLAPETTAAGPRGGGGDADVEGTLTSPAVSPQAHYALAIGAVADEDYRLEARPRGVQARDTECVLFVLERSGLRSARDAAGRDTTRRCWAGA